jgi:hypothetical protein
MKITIRPLTPDLWPAIEDLFGENGAVGGCWCYGGAAGGGKTVELILEPLRYTHSGGEFHRRVSMTGRGMGFSSPSMRRRER